MSHAIDAHVLKRLLIGRDLNGDREALSGPARRMANHLAGLEPGHRKAAWHAMTAALEDGPALIRAVDQADPDTAPLEDEDAPARFATVADVRRRLSETRWTWPGWIPAGRIFGIGGFEGTGKTRYALDLARRVYLAEPWPDGQDATLPAGTRTLWLCADGHHDELAEMLPAFGLPDEAIVFPATPDEPYEGTDLDASEVVGPGGILESAIRAVKPGLVFIDTLTNATRRDLCSQDEMKGLKTPLVRLVQTFGVNIGLLVHLNKEGKILGRRVGGLTRTLHLLECPDPEEPGRLRLWVEKSYARKPPPLGVTMGDHGNDYDLEPPSKVALERRKPGPLPAKIQAAMEWLSEKLDGPPVRVADLRKEAAADGIIPSESSAGTLYRARDEIGAEEIELDGRKWWRVPDSTCPSSISDNPRNPEDAGPNLDKTGADSR